MRLLRIQLCILYLNRKIQIKLYRRHLFPHVPLPKPDNGSSCERFSGIILKANVLCQDRVSRVKTPHSMTISAGQSYEVQCNGKGIGLLQKFMFTNAYFQALFYV